MPYRKYDLSADLILREGRSLRVRPIRPDDRDRLRDLFYRVSPRTRYLRFQYPKEHISDEELTYYTNVKPPAQYAYVATFGQGTGEVIIAVARWYLLADRRTAEVALLVDDDIQMSGVGTALLERLAETAEKYSVKRFLAAVLPENTRMLDVFSDSGFRIERKLEEGVYQITIDLTEQEEFSKRQAYRESIARSAGIRKLLFPRTVAVVGASRKPKSVGGAIFRNLLQGGFEGTVFPVNPNTVSVAGVMSYPSVLEVPADVDLAVIVVPAQLVPDVIDQCAKKNVQSLVIISAGFGEAGSGGRALQEEVRAKIGSYGMRLVGPNCLGIINTDPEIRLNATFSPVSAPRAGNLSLASQSGALGLALLDYAENIRLGIRSFASIGNRIDISSNDFMLFWEDDPETEVIALYLESFGNPRKFSRIARRVSRKKPIIAVKAGKSAVGARAATSHTGALAAADVAVDAMFRQAGVIRVNTIEEMFNVVRLLAHQPPPRGPNVGILTNAGGPGVLAADACEGWQLSVPSLSEETQRRLREFLPPEAAVGNPVDMIASAPPASYKKAVKVMLEDESLDALILIYIPPLVTEPREVAAAITEALREAEAEKPVLACFMMLKDAQIELSIDQRRSIPAYVFPEDAVQSLALSYQYSRYSRREEGEVVRYREIEGERIREELLEKAASPPDGRWLMPEEAIGLLKSYGIPAPPTRAALSEEEAAEVAAELGYPVAMKIRSLSLVHKTDAGGIALGLGSAEEVREAWRNMMNAIKDAGHEGEVEGVVLQPMARAGQELIVGMVQDNLFGPLVMLGMGGIHVEITRDIAFSLHPLTDLDPERMIEALKGKQILKGVRGSKPRDLEALRDVLLRFSALIEDIPEIDQIETNPLIIYEEGGGCTAVDSRIFIKPAEQE